MNKIINILLLIGALHFQLYAQNSDLFYLLNNDSRFNADLSYQTIGLQHLNLSKLVKLSARIHWVDSLKNFSPWSGAGINYLQSGVMRQQQIFIMQGLELNLTPKLRANYFLGFGANGQNLNTVGLNAGNQWDAHQGVLNETISGETWTGNRENGFGYLIGGGLIYGGISEMPKYAGNFILTNNLNKMQFNQLSNFWSLDLHYQWLHTPKSWFYLILDINNTEFINPSRAGLSSFFMISEVSAQKRQTIGVNLLLTERFEPYLSASLNQDRYLLTFFFQSGEINSSGIKISYNLGRRRSKHSGNTLPPIENAVSLSKIPDLMEAATDQQIVEEEKAKFYLELKHTFNFAINEEAITDSDKRFLDQVVKLVAQNPGVYLKIIGHTDNTGDSTENLQLSWRRARTVAGYLIEEGVENQYCEISGAGDRFPLVPNNTPANRRKNRRVEFVIYEK